MQANRIVMSTEQVHHRIEARRTTAQLTPQPSPQARIFPTKKSAASPAFRVYDRCAAVIVRLPLQTKSPAAQKILTLSFGKLGCAHQSVSGLIPTKDQTHNLPPILPILRIAKRHHPNNLALHRITEVLDGAMRQRRTLAVPAGHDLGARALRGSLLKEGPHGSDAVAVGAARKQIGRDGGWVVDALYCD